MKKVLLLGGNGFVGKHLKSFFSNMPKEYEITAPDRKELEGI